MTATASVPGEASPANPEICSTHASRAIDGVLSACDTYRMLGTVVGESGTGKTSTAMNYAASHPNAMFVRLGQSAEKTRAGLAQIAAALGLHDLHGATESDVCLAIAGSLRYSGSPLLILDETQRASDGLLEHVRDFYDALGVAAVLIGSPSLTDRWTARHKGRGQSVGPLLGRLGPRVRLDRVRADDVAAIADHHGVTDAAGTQVLKHAAGLPGGLHNVAQALRIARGIQGDGKPLSADALRKAAVLTEVA